METTFSRASTKLPLRAELVEQWVGGHSAKGEYSTMKKGQQISGEMVMSFLLKHRTSETNHCDHLVGSLFWFTRLNRAKSAGDYGDDVGHKTSFYTFFPESMHIREVEDEVSTSVTTNNCFKPKPPQTLQNPSNELELIRSEKSKHFPEEINSKK